jgi:hypothetical protein
MKLWGIIQCGVILAALTAGLIAMNTTTNSGLKDIDTVTEFQQINAEMIKYSSEKIVESDMIEYLKSTISVDSLSLHSPRQVIVVAPTENIKQYYGSFMQEVIVKDVIEGDDSIIDKKIHIAAIGGLDIIDGTITMLSSYGNNIMLPGNDYLVFCEIAETSDYMEIPLYRAMPSMLSWLNLNSDYSKSIESDSDALYSEYNDSEFLGCTQVALDATLKAKSEVINEYLGDAYV